MPDHVATQQYHKCAIAAIVRLNRMPGMFHIIESDPVNRENLRMMISLFGYRVLAFASSAEYVADNGRRECRPAAIFSDVPIPPPDGYEPVEDIRDYIPDQRFVIVTNYPQLEKSEKRPIYQYIRIDLEAGDELTIRPANTDRTFFRPEITI